VELDAIENNNARGRLQFVVDELAAQGICRKWAADLVMMVYLHGLRNRDE